MDVQKIVENIQRVCKEKGTTPTVAARESGAGSSLVTNMKKKGTMPSIEKIYLLSSYLGVTMNELVGEDIITSSRGPEQPYLVRQYNLLSKEAQMEVMAFIEFKAAQAVKPDTISPWRSWGTPGPPGRRNWNPKRKRSKTIERKKGCVQVGHIPFQRLRFLSVCGILVSCKKGGANSERRNAHERIGSHRATYARDCGCFSGLPDKEITAPRP